jgi:hypothetical protein
VQRQAGLGSAILDKAYGSSNKKRQLFKVLGSSWSPTKRAARPSSQRFQIRKREHI